MGEIGITCCENLRLLEASGRELPALGISEEHFNSSRYSEGYNSDKESLLLNGNIDAIDQPPDELHIVESDPSISSNMTAGEQKDGHHSPPHDNNAILTDHEKRSETSLPLIDETNRGYQSGGNVSEKGERGLCVLEPTLRSPRVDEEEICEFPSTLPPQTLGGDELGSVSSIDTVLQGGYNHIFVYESRDQSVCGDSFVGTSGLAKDCSSSNSITEETDGFSGHHPALDDPINLKTNSVDKSTYCPIDNKMEESHIFNSCTADGLCLENMRPHTELENSHACSPLEDFDTNIQVSSEEERSHASFMEGTSCCLTQGLLDVEAPCLEGEQSVSAQSSQFLKVVEDCPMKLPSALENGVNSTPTVCNGVSDIRKQADDAEKVDLKFNSVFVFRRTNNKRAASSRKPPCDGKPERRTREAHTTGESRQAANNSASVSSSVRISTNKVTMKRSHSHQVPRATVWGTVGNLLGIFDLSGGISKFESQVYIQNKGSKKARGSGRRRRCPAAQKHGSSRGLKAKRASSTIPVRLKDQRVQRLLFSIPVDASPSTDNDLNDSCHNFDCHSDLATSKAASEPKHKLGVDGCSAVQLTCHYDKDLESSVTPETSVASTIGDCQGVSSRSGVEALVISGNDGLLSDPETPPDSEAPHPTSHIGISKSEIATSTILEPSLDAGIMGQNDFAPEFGNQESLCAGEVCISVSPVVMQKHARPTEGKKNIKVVSSPFISPELFPPDGNLHAIGSLTKTRKPKKYTRPQMKKQEGSNPRNSSNVNITGNASKCKKFLVERPTLEFADKDCQETLKVEAGLGDRTLCGQDAEATQLDVRVAGSPSSRDNTKRHKLPKGTKAGVSKHRSSSCYSAKPTRQNAHGKKKTLESSVSKRKMDRQHLGQAGTNDACLEGRGDLSTSFSGMAHDIIGSSESSCGTNAGNKVASEGVISSVMAPASDDLASKNSSHGLEGQIFPPRAAWVSCDDCHKWRFIPTALADIIDETKCRWTCKDNSDKAFADCSIPQEKTNAEINAELDISEASGEENSSSAKPKPKVIENTTSRASQRPSWARIKCNLFLHRSRKTQTVDEIMVCHCKRPSDGSLGCGDDCLNRMLNIECVQGTCPCGELCSNKQFQKRKYAKFKWFRCGKKGYGLQVLEAASQGSFLIEYVGEVLDLADYEARQRDYASKGQKHFYFMTLNGSEVIDACAKGNLGRFINHSCEPNCRTEKWMVNGEVCIGLFAIRDIKKGEEVTFDYNYVRVFGAAVKKCVCGSAECRGYIGGDPTNTEVIVQGDSDEEYSEPVIIQEDVGIELDTEDNLCAIDDVTPVQHEEVSLRTQEIMNQPSPAVAKLEIPLQDEDSNHRSLSHVLPSETSSQTSNYISKSLSDPVVGINKSTPEIVEDKPHTSKSHPHKKSSRSSGPVKKSRCSGNKLVGPKARKTIIGARSGRFEGVEEKLNELLDADGGISKRKDATKGYLKLLFVTAASGHSVEGEAVQSTRDLSLILDALLKTKSRIVLTDIISKNGLQMLHNIMKQNQRNINKIPIIRKLLKVLEFLALKEILNQEHINCCPSHAGVESLKDSIMKLTYHNDIQVHQIARNFRDKWIPRALRKINLSDRHEGWLDSQHAYSNQFLQSSFKRHHHDLCVKGADASYCAGQTAHLLASSLDSDASFITSQQGSNSAPTCDTNPATGTRPRKRKSRWDQPSDNANVDQQSPVYSEDFTIGTSSKSRKPVLSQTKSVPRPEIPNQMSGSKTEDNGYHNGDAGTSEFRQDDMDEEVPPGFGSPVNNHHNHHQVPSNSLGEMVVGHPQQRYLSQLTVSYGIPLALVEQLGTPEAEARGNRPPSWAIAPGVPFHPFPPLPPFPRVKQNPISDHEKMGGEAREEAQPTGWYTAACQSDSSVPSASGQTSPDITETGVNNMETVERVGPPSNGCGRKDFRPQKWNNRGYQRDGSPWSSERNGNRFRDSTNNVMSRLGVRNSRKELGDGVCLSGGLSSEDYRSTFPEQLQHNQS